MKFTYKRFIDPEKETNGNGLSPETAMNEIPSGTLSSPSVNGAESGIINDCIYFIKRTPCGDGEFNVNTKFCHIPQYTADSGIKKIAFVGAPKENEEYWFQLTSTEQSSLNGLLWNSGNYATMMTASSQSSGRWNIRMSSGTVVARNINFLRSVSSILFAAPDYASNTKDSCFMFYLGSMDIIDFQYCRFSAFGVYLDDPGYTNHNPPMYACGYISANYAYQSITISNCVINFLPRTYYCNSTYGYNLPGFDIRYCNNLSFCNNTCYMTQSNTETYENGTTGIRDYSETCLLVAGDSYTYFISVASVNYNTMYIRCSDNKNLSRYMNVVADSIEFIGNRVLSGANMSVSSLSVFQKQRKLFLYKNNFIQINPEDCVCHSYIIKDFYINVPELWTIYDCNVFWFSCKMRENRYSANGRFRGNGERIIENINIILGNGPSDSEVLSSDLSVLNAQIGSMGCAFQIVGKYTNGGETYYYYSNNGNYASNININSPWMYAIIGTDFYVRDINIVGAAQAGNSCSLNIENMVVQHPRGMEFTCTNVGCEINVKNLYVESSSREGNMFYCANYGVYSVYIENSNISIANRLDMSSVCQNRNESLILQRNIGTSHSFSLCGGSRYIESCSMKYDNENTLRCFARNSSAGAMCFKSAGGRCITKKTLTAGRYKITVHCCYYREVATEEAAVSSGDFNYSSGSATSGDIRYGFSTAVTTKWGNYVSPREFIDDSANSYLWDFNSIQGTNMIPFKHEFFIDVKEDSEVGLTLDNFSAYSSKLVDISNPYASIYFNPNFEYELVDDWQSNS